MHLILELVKHPEYRLRASQWERFRITAQGGREFIETFVKMFSTRETHPDFLNRKAISYCAAIAKKSVRRIINSITQRLVDVSRNGGAPSYIQAIDDANIDFEGNTINSFMARRVIPDLLNIGKVGVFIDKEPVPANATAKDTQGIRPYLYTYSALDILSWDRDTKNQLVLVLLRDRISVRDEHTGLVKGTEVRYRLLRKTDNGVSVTWFARGGDQINEVLLDLTEIPFVIFELSQSLLEDVADYQVAATNLASSDINYTMTGNFPFYTEQLSGKEHMQNIRGAGADTPGRGDTSGSGVPDATNQPGTAAYAKQSRARQMRAGGSQGRSYPQNTDRPGFIHPSPEPLLASMKKQEAMAEEVDRLVEQTLTTVESKRIRQAAGEKPNSGLEAGLSNIGIELEFGERKIARIWSMYEDDTSEFSVDYPEHFSLRSEQDKRDEASELRKSLPTIPSLTYQKEVAKKIAVLELRGKIATSTMTTITDEIDAAVVVAIDSDVIRKDHEAGLVSDKTASEARGYPRGEHLQARKDRAIRVKLTLNAQTRAVNGVPESQAELAPSASRGTQEEKINEEK